MHCDMNSFYASCEVAYHPELQGKAIAVCGDPERRSGIVLTASYPAKRMGVKTGMPLWEAQQHCRDIIFVPAHYDLYTRFSSYTREIFLRFTDQVEPFGLDEAWLDCTASRTLFGNGEEIAKKISDTIKDELGITCSIGVSWNKILAKLGSDYKKPDAITVINKDNFQKISNRRSNGCIYCGDEQAQVAYTVTIPATVTLDSKATITATGVTLPDDKQLNVKVAKDSEFKVALDGDPDLDTCEYTVTNVTDGGTEVKPGDNPVLTAVNGVTESSVELQFNKPETTTYSGEYKGTVKFTVSVDDNSAS